jgi:chromatin remodeling complex protein RSC6
MPRTSKPTDAPVSVSAPVSTKASKEPKAPKESKPKKEAVVAAVSAVSDAAPKAVKAPKAAKKEAVVAAVSDAAVAVEGEDAVVDAESSFVEKSDEFVSKIQQVTSLLATLKGEFKTLQKQYVRDIKAAQKQGTKRKRKTGTRSPSGFVKPTRISDELASFLDKPSGTEMARTEVTRDINKYIRTHNLQDKENGRKINPDTKLAGLLKLKESDELTYFNLQKYMSHHFAKAVKAVVATA